MMSKRDKEALRRCTAVGLIFEARKDLDNSAEQKPPSTNKKTLVDLAARCLAALEAILEAEEK